MVRASVYSQIFDLLRTFQRKNKFTNRAYESPLSISQAQLLGLIREKKRLTAQEISEIANLEKSSVARAISSLERRRFLKREVDKHDARNKTISLTPSGIKMLKRIDQNAAKSFARFTNPLPKNKMLELERFMDSLADGDGAYNATRNKFDPPGRLQIKRLTQSFGVTSRSFVGSGFSSIEWQVLSTIAYSEVPITLKQLAIALAMPHSSLSVLLGSLRKQGLLKGSSNRLLRGELLALTTSGKESLEQIEKLGEMKIKNALKVLTLNEVKHGAKLMAAWIGENIELQDRLPPIKADIRELKDEQLRSFARGIIIENSVRSNNHHTLPASLFAEDAKIFGIFDNNKLEGVVVFDSANRALHQCGVVSGSKLSEELLINLCAARLN